MPTTKMYEGRAIQIDPNEYPNTWTNADFIYDFITAANEQCHHFLPHDWYVNGVYEDSRTIVVGLERYKEGLNLQPLWNFRLTADPYEENVTGDRQWIVFDVVRWQPDTVYSFQIP
jgi:hypothetical protein